jgi:cytochrome c6
MENEQQPIGVGPWLFGVVAGLIVVALLIAAYSTGYERGKSAAPSRRSAAPATKHPAPAANGPGRQLFASTCGSCHTLKAAGTHGTIGPDLDQIKPDAARVLAAMQNGGTGSGAMPRALYSGAKAKQVADFVSQVAGG